MDVTPEIVQPLELDEVVAVPALTDAPLPERTPQVEGMNKLAGYALSPRDRVIVDARVGPSMQEAATGVQSELDQHEQAFDQERTRLHLEADSEAAAAQARAEEDQQFEVEQGRQDLAGEQERTLAQQQAGVDGALGELAMSRDASRREIDDRLATDRATVDEIYDAAAVDVQTQVEEGHAKADAVKGATADKANAESWWDWTIDTWQVFVQWFAANLVAIWEDVNQIVAGLFDRAIQLATEVVNGAVAFVKRAISAYYDLWLSLADRLLGNVFPELAAALRTAIEELKTRVFEALDAVAAGYLRALRVVADALVAGLDAGVQAYRIGVAAYLALWETIQQGQWDQVGRTVLTAILTAAGIDPGGVLRHLLEIRRGRRRCHCRPRPGGSKRRESAGARVPTVRRSLHRQLHGRVHRVDHRRGRHRGAEDLQSRRDLRRRLPNTQPDQVLSATKKPSSTWARGRSPPSKSSPTRPGPWSPADGRGCGTW